MCLLCLRCYVLTCERLQFRRGAASMPATTASHPPRPSPDPHTPVDTCHLIELQDSQIGVLEEEAFRYDF